MKNSISMQSMKVALQEKGRIALPREIKEQIDIGASDYVVFNVLDDGIRISKHYHKCDICSSKENLSPYKRGHICSDCLSKIKSVK